MRLDNTNDRIAELDRAIELSKQSAFNIQSMNKQMGFIASEIEEMKTGYRQLATDVKNVNADLQQYKQFNDESQYIRPDQAQELQVAAKERIASLLDKYGEQAKNKYFGKFMARLWNDAKNARLIIGAKGIYTPQRNYESAKNYINSWTPYKYGIDGYIEHLKKLEQLNIKVNRI